MTAESDRFGDAFRSAATPLASATVAATASSDYLDTVKSQIERCQEAIAKAADTDKALPFVQGDAAEPWHAGTLNIDAVRRGGSPSAEAPRETTAYSPDVVFAPGRSDPAQLKYYRSAEESARALADPGYAGMDLVPPADQLAGARAYLLRRAEQLGTSDPDAAQRYADAAGRLTDRLSHEGAASTPLTRAQAEELVQDIREDGHLDLGEWGLALRQQVDLSDEAREVADHALDAAEIAFALQLTGYVMSTVQRAVDEGSLTTEDLRELALGPSTAVAKSAFTGTVAGGLALAAGEGLLGDAAEALAPETLSLLGRVSN